MKTTFSKFIALWERYQRYIGISGLALGFTFDLYLAKRPDSIPDNLLLLSYIFIAGAIIVLLNLRSAPRGAEEHPAEPLLLLLILQFCFGGLANNLLILYGKSGSLGSFIFVALLATFALGNEFLKSRYAQLRFNIGIYYFLVLTYCVISIPTFVLHEVSVREFLLSGAASLIFMIGFLGVVYTAVFHGRQRSKQLYEVSLLVVIIFVIFNGFYFLNIIPPVPLSLKQIGIYHTIVKDGDAYTASYEHTPWYIFWRDTSATYTVAAGEPAYCFSAVFAPGGLSTPIYHRWEYYDTDTGDWITVGYVSFPINGGRAQGYRGFSEKHVLTSGAWRCDVETAGGQLIGRITFDILQSSTTTPALSTTTL